MQVHSGTDVDAMQEAEIPRPATYVKRRGAKRPVLLSTDYKVKIIIVSWSFKKINNSYSTNHCAFSIQTQTR